MGALVAAAVLAGCYGSTEPATNVGIDRATLTAKGTTNAGAAHIYFEYWPTGQPASVLATIGKDIPGGVTGPYSEATADSFRGLKPATGYTYRVCGKDQSSPNGACAQTRTFTTSAPAGDLIRGDYATLLGGIGHRGAVDAHSDASGANAGGTLSLPEDKHASPIGNFSGNVTCLRVEGNKATVGAVGSVAGQPTTALLVYVDNDLNWIEPTDQLDWTETPGTTPPNCASGSFTSLRSLAYSSTLVYDAP